MRKVIIDIYFFRWHRNNKTLEFFDAGEQGEFS